MTQNPWLEPKLAEDYSKMVGQPEHNWFEEEINIPELLKMIPDNVQSALDFGCGPGSLTVKLTEHSAEVTGTDISQAMINLATENYPDTKFAVWDGITANSVGKFDLIFSKLTLQFVEDLNGVANSFHEHLNPGGHVLFSVPHPARTSINTGVDYHTETPYEIEIGESGISVTMIHRSLEQYVTAFTMAGFVLDSINEPDITDDTLHRHGKDLSYAALPIRLNLRMSKIK